MKYCSKCGVQMPDDADYCPACGAPTDGSSYNAKVENNDGFSQDMKNILKSDGENVSPKSRLVAALLAFFLGGLGIHQFYLGKTKSGVLMLVFAFTGIPSIIAFIHFIIILCGSATDSDGKAVKAW